MFCNDNWSNCFEFVIVQQHEENNVTVCVQVHDYSWVIYSGSVWLITGNTVMKFYLCIPTVTNTSLVDCGSIVSLLFVFPFGFKHVICYCLYICERCSIENRCERQELHAKLKILPAGTECCTHVHVDKWWSVHRPWLYLHAVCRWRAAWLFASSVPHDLWSRSKVRAKSMFAFSASTALWRTWRSYSR